MSAAADPWLITPPVIYWNLEILPMQCEDKSVILDQSMPMKQIVLLFLVLLTKGSLMAQICHPQLHIAPEDGVCNANPYVVVFEDHFNSDSLDLSTWQIQPWGQGSLAGDNTQQYYSLDNVSVSNGICSITALRDTVLRRAVSWLPDDTLLADSLPNLRMYYYTSSNIWTLQKFGHGIFEIRCRIPSGKGYWPAFWGFGADSAGSSEIDVFEFWDDDTETHHMTVHHDGMMCKSESQGPDFSLAFHTFSLVWDAYKTDWYVDGVLKRHQSRYHTILGQYVDCDEVEANHLYILEKSFPEDSLHIIMNLAIQAGPFAPDSATPFPASLEVDYVRYSAQIPVTAIVNVTDTSALVQTERSMRVYPNPALKTLQIEFSEGFPEELQICLLSMQGELVYGRNAASAGEITIDLSGFSPGIYSLIVLDEKGLRVHTHTVIIR